VWDPALDSALALESGPELEMGLEPEWGLALDPAPDLEKDRARDRATDPDWAREQDPARALEQGRGSAHPAAAARPFPEGRAAAASTKETERTRFLSRPAKDLFPNHAGTRRS
jgi:hypothetical protein